jgi:hypothetical protein
MVDVELPSAINVVGLALRLELKVDTVAALTVTLSRSFVAVLMTPSVAAIRAVSAVYKIIEAVATPLEKLMFVPVPNEELATLGIVPPGEIDAPEKIKFFNPA